MIALIPLLPLLGFLINGLWYAFFQAAPGRSKASAGLTGGIATLAILGSFVVSVLLFLQLQELPAQSRVLDQVLFPWISFGGFKLDLAFRLDPLASLFTLVVTGVGALIHLYSIGYMGHDATPGKFFAYLNLFCFAMLMLVLGASLPILFLGWEGVGLCSYLLIGYWYTDDEKASAGKKAFIVNRVGDLGFLLGMFLIFSVFGTLDFAVLQSAVTQGGQAALPAGVTEAAVTAICLLLFVGCMGKSAQIPLYVWLPDAMAGPTPVSALIHAATMVTSGIYMVARLNALFSLSPTAMAVVAVVGGVTAFFAATIAITQRDIKKVLAYSTVSQLGYMFLACGVGAYATGVFHVITHAFFKALMFLGAGSVIHGMHEEQDIMKMGGLRGKMPVTFFTFAMGWLAISGIPPFSGFFSKDEVLWLAFSSQHGSFLLWGLGALTAVMTAFYMTRLFSLTFLGKPRFDERKLGAAHGHDEGHGHAPAGVHESPWTMTAPLQVLALLSLVGGFIGIPHLSWIEHWLEPVIPAHHASAEVAPHMEWVLMALSVVGAVIGITVALRLYANLDRAKELAVRWAGLHRVLFNKWYVDELYDALFVRPIHGLSQVLWKRLDVAVIDRLVLGFGKASLWSGQAVRVIQTGSIQLYALVLLIGIVVSVGYLIYGMA
ncbi:MAG: NADH-quinone oxidoreductase subunit L [Oligoflexia bacterium]|nr:NADH-quinone oxidoreductase subunit L [Oligoflexia bacterium]